MFLCYTVRLSEKTLLRIFCFVFCVCASYPGGSKNTFSCFILQNMYLLTEWEGRTGKYLARGQDLRTERNEARTS